MSAKDVSLLDQRQTKRGGKAALTGGRHAERAAAVEPLHPAQLECVRRERRPHAAGKLGAALAGHAFERGWVERLDRTRAVRVTPAGEAGFVAAFSLSLV